MIMSTVIPRLVFGTGEFEDSDSANEKHGGSSDVRSQWSTESSYKGIDSPRSARSSGNDSKSSALQIVVDATLSPGASPRSPYSSRQNSPRLDDSVTERSRTQEPKNDTATPQHNLYIKTPTNAGRRNLHKNDKTSMKEWMENYAQDGVFVMALGVAFAKFCDDDGVLDVSGFHRLIIELQLMHDAVSLLEEKSPGTPKSLLQLTPLSRRKSSIESEEDQVAAFVTRNLQHLPFQHELIPLLETLDRDGDGSVTYSELREWIKRGMCMPEAKLERFRASGNIERKLVSFLENIMDLSHSVSDNLHDDLYAHDRMGTAKLDRNGFIDILNGGARLSREFIKKKHAKEFLRNRGLKWINEETLSHLCAEAVGSQLEEYERRYKRSCRKRRKSSRKNRRNRKDTDSDYSTDSESEESDLSSSDDEVDGKSYEERRREKKVISLLRKLSFKYVKKAMEDPLETSTCRDNKAVVEEIESRRSLKLQISSTEEEEEEEPLFSEISKSSEDGSEEGISDASNRIRKQFSGPNDSHAHKKRADYGKQKRSTQLFPAKDIETKVVIQRRWTNFFSSPTENPSHLPKPGSKTMDSVINMRRSSRNEFDIEKNRKALEAISRSSTDLQDKGAGTQRSNCETNPRKQRRPSLLRRLGLAKKK